MKNARARIGSILLACALVLSFMPVTAMAEGGSCTEGLCSHEAAIGETHYHTLEDAVIAVKSSGEKTIQLLQDVEIEAQLELPAGTVLDGQGHSITAGDTVWSSVEPEKYMLVCASDVTVQDVTIDAGKNAYGCLQFFKATGGRIEGKVALVHAKQLGLNVNASQVTAAGTLRLAGNGWGDVINVGWGSGISGYTGSCTFDAREAELAGVASVYADKHDISHAGGIEKFEIRLSDDFVLLNQTEAGYAYISAAAEFDGKKYATLAAAVDAVIAEGNKTGTVTLLKNSSGAGISLPDEDGTVHLTIDFNGNTYTCTAPATGVRAARTQAIYLGEHHDVTFKNGTITSAAGSGVNMLVQNDGELTLDSMVLDGVNLTGGHAVLNNCGNMAVADSTVNAPSAGTALGVCWGSHHGDSRDTLVMIEGTSKISGGIHVKTEGAAEEVRSINTLTIHGGIFAGELTVDPGLHATAADGITISGGQFASEPHQDYIAEGHEVLRDGEWFVVGKPDLKVALNATELTLLKGGSTTLVATVTPDNGGRTVTWRSENADVATVDGGVVTAVGTGTTVITAAADGGAQATCVVTVPAEGTGVLPSVVDPDVKVDPALEDLEEETAKVVTDTANSVTASGALSDAAQQHVENLDRDSEQRDALLEKGKEQLEAAEDETVTLYSQTYLEITATGAETAQGEVTSVTLNITPMVQVVASTASTASDVNDGNSAVVKEAEKLSISASTEITVQLPAGFAGRPVYIRHEAFDRLKTYYYKAAASADGTVTFTNPHGFSPFTFSLENGAAAEVGDIGYPTLQAAVEEVPHNGTILLTGNNDETIEVQKNVTFILDTNGHRFTGSISAGSHCQMTVSLTEDGKTIYTFTDIGDDSDGSGENGGSGDSGSESGGYVITVVPVNGGKVTVSPGRAEQGKTVTITAVPNSGYVLDGLTVTAKNGNGLEVADKGNGKYTFTMPGGAVTVKAVFVPKETAMPFADVPKSFWAYDEIKWAYENDYMNGISDAAFSPHGILSRQQVWMTLARMAGETPANMAEAKAWAVSQGISDGSNPGAAVTRQQLGTLLYRFAGKNGYDTSDQADLSDYPDAGELASYAVDAMAWAVANGIISGTTAGTLQPAGTANRAQFAAVLWRFYQTSAD